MTTPQRAYTDADLALAVKSNWSLIHSDLFQDAYRAALMADSIKHDLWKPMDPEVVNKGRPKGNTQATLIRDGIYAAHKARGLSNRQIAKKLEWTKGVTDYMAMRHKLMQDG